MHCSATLAMLSFATRAFGGQPMCLDGSWRMLVAVICLVAQLGAGAFGQRVTWTSSNVTGKPTPPSPYQIVPVLPERKFENPKCVVQIPGTDRLLVAHAGSKLVSFPKRTSDATTSLVADLKDIERVFAGPNTVAFHPNFLKNRFVFVAMGHEEGGWHSRVMRYTLTDTLDPRIEPGSGRPIIRWPAGGHGGGCLDFGPDGYLYISVGDGSGPTPPDKRDTGQDVSDLLGSVLRIDVDTDEPYRIPEDNPFVELENARPEIWSYGLRNPWKFGIDPQSGDIFVADNGWETWEMIHKLHRGSNCGWPIMEGRARLRSDVKLGPTPITPPIKDHPHTEANSVIGGPVYRGKKFADLDGSFVYGDYITGTIWTLIASTEGGYEHRTLCDTDLHIVAFTEGSEGEIYLLDYDTTGQLYQLKKSERADTSATFPKRLSETGIFSDAAMLTPAAGVLPYQIVAEPWSDGAAAKRWVGIPGDGRIDFGDSPSAVGYPEGTVLVKHLSIATADSAETPIETQLLHFQNGSWNPYSYLWNGAANDAELVDARGVDREIEVLDDGVLTKRTWHVGSTNECRLCHNVGSNVVLGFRPRQLRAATAQQWSQLTAGGFVSKSRGASEDQKLVNPYDGQANLDDRARSYLHMNCGVCHNRQGPATISFFAHRDYDFDELRITKRPGIGDFGIQSPQLISPGSPYQSIILYRLAKLGYGRMPYVGSRLVDSQGVALIADWVRSLKTLEQAEPANTEVDLLLQSTHGALQLATAMHKGELGQADKERVFKSLDGLHGDIRGLFDDFISESERRQTLGQNPDLASVLNLTGDAARGELIFFSDNARCKSCHNTSDREVSLGPTFVELRKKYQRRSDYLRQILSPSEKVDPQFAAWNVVIDDGRTFVGMLESRTDEGIVLRTADKNTVRLNTEEIEVMRKSERSLMPVGLLSDLTPQEAADLLAFLVKE